MKPFLIATVALLFTLVAVVGLSYGFVKVSQKKVITPDATAQVYAEQTNDTWGQIAYSGGKVKKNFSIKNTGAGILKLYGATTSCACTTGQLKTEKNTSPLFGMHLPMSTTFEVNPGKEAQIEMVFDPAFHGPSGIGPISRTVTINTNDPKRPTLEFTVSGVVVR